MMTTRRILRTRAHRALALTALAALLAACGGSNTGSSPNDDASTPASEDHMDDDHMDDDHSDETYSFGEPADEADADRTIEVDAADSMSYEPASIEVTAGETIAFKVTNSGSAVHEFILGDQAKQDEHEAEMQEMMASGETMTHSDPNGISLQPGETKTLTWHFTTAGEIIFGCHQPGHYAAGMHGDLTVS